MTDRELLAVSIEEAQRRKWVEGRAEYGPEWAGDRPMVEGFSELIDFLNYVDEDHAQGHITADQREAIRDEAIRLARFVRVLCGSSWGG